MLNGVATMGCDALNLLDMETLGAKVKRLRRKKPIERIARLAGITRDAIWRLESGRTPNPRWDTIEGLAKAFGITPDELLENTEGNDLIRAPAHDHILLEDDEGTKLLLPADDAGKAYAERFRASGKSLREFLFSDNVQPIDLPQTAKINQVDEPKGNGEKTRKPKAGS